MIVSEFLLAQPAVLRTALLAERTRGDKIKNSVNGALQFDLRAGAQPLLREEAYFELSSLMDYPQVVAWS